jgi:aminoglycoside phosphotransferase (APT) family kinase protein
MVDNNQNNSLFADIGDDKEFMEKYGEQIGAGMSAVIYAHKGVAAKVFRESQYRRQAFQEAFTMVVIETLNIPAPRVYGVETFQNRPVLLMDHVKGVSLNDIAIKNPEKTDECIGKVVELQALMHKSFSNDFRPLKMVLNGNIIASPGLSQEEKEQLISKLSKLPDGDALCHGDFHGGNILFDGKNYSIIDWAEVACGAPAADACRSYLDYIMGEMKYAEIYLDKYSALTGRSKEEVLAWLPVVAGSIYGYLSEEAKKIARKYF